MILCPHESIVLTVLFAAANGFLFCRRGNRGPMAAIRVSPRSLERTYRRQSKALVELAAGLPERPSPQEVHDLRVSIRRIQMMRGLMPRAVRDSRASKRFDLTLKSVLKSTSQLRDLDTLVDTIQQHKASLPAELLVTLGNQRSDAAARAKAAAHMLTEAPPPYIDSDLMRKRKVSRRLRKRIRREGSAIVGLLAKVLGDEKGVEELHALRKRVKRLRYLLELADDTPPELAILTTWQEALGSIHDLDVAISYIQGRDLELKGKAVRELQLARHSNYLSFVRQYRTDSVEVLESSDILEGGPVSSRFTVAEV